MIVLAESNFVLELAFQQEERDEVERLVEMAEAREVELVILHCKLLSKFANGRQFIENQTRPAR